VGTELSGKDFLPPGYKRRGRTMGVGDKFENAKDKLAGKAKESTGKATDDEELEAEGKVDQSKADLKQAGEKALRRSRVGASVL
jgi:uncharacterized protein YjbJ (UPF0337 family)